MSGTVEERPDRPARKATDVADSEHPLSSPTDGTLSDLSDGDLQAFPDLGFDPEAVRPPQVDEEEASAAAADLVNHLLWHKALIDENDGGERLDDYIELVRRSEKGEHLSIRDPFNKSIALAFELVLQEHLNPWKIDLGEFSRMYLKRAGEEEIDLVTAGRIILMAWTVLKLQSDAMVELAERLAAPPEEPEPEFLDWGDIGDWGGDNEEFEYTQRVKHSNEAPIDEKIRRKGAHRKVTLMELVDAFEEVRREAEERVRLNAERERLRALMKGERNDAVRDMVHNEDPEEEQREVWSRIMRLNGTPIPLTKLYDREIDSFVAAFNSVLFLAADRKVDIWQEDFPYGPILVKNLLHGAHTPTPEETGRIAHANEGPHPQEEVPEAAEPSESSTPSDS